MKKLTKQQRKEIYEKVYKRASLSNWAAAAGNPFICNHLEEISKIAKRNLFEYFPEFDLMTPDNYEKKWSYPFCCKEYNPELNGAHYSYLDFRPIQQNILLLCIEMCK